MSNNVTRKGLAFGALVALTSTAIAGAPAFAAGELNVVPSAGTSFVVSTTDTFNLVTTFAPGFTPSSYAQLKYQIVTDGVATIDAGVSTGAALAAADVTAGPTLAPNSGTNHTTVISASRPSAGTANANTPYGTNDAGAAVTSTTVNYLGLNVAGGTATTATTSVAVTAFVDANNDGALTAGEWNTVKTVTFKKYSEIVPTVTLGAVNTGDTTISATVNWGDLNVDQVAGEGVNFGYSHGSTPTVVPIASGTGATLASGKWTLTTAGALASGTTASAQAKIGSTLLGTAVTGTVTARTINTTNGLVANLVAGNDALATSASAIANTTGGVVRLNGSFVAQVKAFDTTSGTALAAPGVAVVGSVATSNTTLRPAATGVTEISITVNGTKYTTNASLSAATFALTTDATGVAKLNISSVGLSLADTVTATFAAQNLSSSVQAVQTATKYIVTDDAATGASIVVAADKNAATAFNFTVKDQFGVLSSATNQRLKIVSTQGSAVTTYAAVTAGKATFSVSPATDVTTDIDVDTTLQFSTTDSASNVTWADAATTGTATLINASTSNVVDRTIKVRTAAFTFTTAPAVDATTGINNGPAVTSNVANSQKITQLDLAGLNSTTSVVNVAAGDVYAKLTFTGSNAGEKITVSGTDVYVAWDGGTASANSASKVIQTAANTVYVAANTVGTKTITFSNGTETKTVDVKFASTTGTTVRATAANFAVAVAAAAQAGRSIDATVTVTDKWGNPVAGFEATASVAGVASVNGGFSANVTTDANGKATVKLTAGINDLGDAVITFSDNDSNTSTNVTAVAKTVTFGQTDGYIDVLNGKRASVTWSMAKGKRVAFLLNGVRKYNFVQTGDAELNLQFNLKKGTHNIKLIIGGVIVDDITVKITK